MGLFSGISANVMILGLVSFLTEEARVRIAELNA